jgi:hypothetical protein
MQKRHSLNNLMESAKKIGADKTYSNNSSQVMINQRENELKIFTTSMKGSNQVNLGDQRRPSN